MIFKSYYLVLLFLFLCCRNNQSAILQKKTSPKEFCAITIQEIKERLLNKAFSSNISLNECFDIKDSIILGEEDIRWNAKGFYSKGRLIFLAENNWKNDSIISRITFYDSSIETEDSIKVGDSFGKVKRKMSSKIPSVPDGYLYIQHKKDNRLNFELDISEFEDNNRIRYGVSDLALIPDTLMITSIVIK